MASTIVATAITSAVSASSPRIITVVVAISGAATVTARLNLVHSSNILVSIEVEIIHSLDSFIHLANMIVICFGRKQKIVDQFLHAFIRRNNHLAMRLFSAFVLANSTPTSSRTLEPRKDPREEPRGWHGESQERLSIWKRRERCHGELNGLSESQKRTEELREDVDVGVNGRSQRRGKEGCHGEVMDLNYSKSEQRSQTRMSMWEPRENTKEELREGYVNVRAKGRSRRRAKEDVMIRAKRGSRAKVNRGAKGGNISVRAKGRSQRGAKEDVTMVFNRRKSLVWVPSFPSIDGLQWPED
ncbi:Uncharacterized protein TCM_026009 [Theobroma cacao]|uniref:Uncharacterized protein n=1 Tax=Theobroma cacao TaxID=3641 RepID=A0A061F066_THECC|nr:Uncharacterized protein TCM_026009 [Theobroma cacao]